MICNGYNIIDFHTYWTLEDTGIFIEDKLNAYETFFAKNCGTLIAEKDIQELMIYFKDALQLKQVEARKTELEKLESFEIKGSNINKHPIICKSIKSIGKTSFTIINEKSEEKTIEYKDIFQLSLNLRK